MYYTKNEDYLAHHGILGQKWGVRRYQNPDGTLTELGKKRLAKDYKDAQKRIIKGNTKDAWNSLSDLREINNYAVHTKSAERALNDYRAMKEEIDKYNDKNVEIMKDYDKQRTKLSADSAIAEMLEYDGNPTMKTLSDNIFSHVYDDGGQGYLNAASAYLYEKGYKDKTKDLYEKNVKPLYSLNDKLISNIESYVKDEFGKIGADNFYINGNQTRNFQTYIKDHIHSKLTKDGHEYYTFNNGSTSLMKYACNDLGNWDDSMVNNYKKAKTISSNIKNNNDYNTWGCMYRAIDNLGYNDISYDEMTPAMWDKVNSEISKLRKEPR